MRSSRAISRRGRAYLVRGRRIGCSSQYDTGSTRYKQPEGGPSRTDRATPRALLAARPDNAPAGSRTPRQARGHRCPAEGLEHRHYETLPAADSKERPTGARGTRPKRSSLVPCTGRDSPDPIRAVTKYAAAKRANEKGIGPSLNLGVPGPGDLAGALLCGPHTLWHTHTGPTTTSERSASPLTHTESLPAKRGQHAHTHLLSRAAVGADRRTHNNTSENGDVNNQESVTSRKTMGGATAHALFAPLALCKTASK